MWKNRKRCQSPETPPNSPQNSMVSLADSIKRCKFVSGEQVCGACGLLENDLEIMKSCPNHKSPEKSEKLAMILQSMLQLQERQGPENTEEHHTINFCSSSSNHSLQVRGCSKCMLYVDSSYMNQLISSEMAAILDIEAFVCSQTGLYVCAKEYVAQKTCLD